MASKRARSIDRVAGATEGSLAEKANLPLEFPRTSEPLPVSNELRLLTDRIVADLERHVAPIVEMNQSLPGFREVADESFWCEVEQIIRMNIPVFYRVMLDGWAPSEHEVLANQAYTRRCVERQIPLESHLEGYRKGMWILWGHLVEEVIRRRPALQIELLLRTVSVLRNVEVVAGVLSKAYFSELEGRARHRHAALRDLFGEIIDGGTASADSLKARAAALRLDVDAAHDVVVIEAKSGRGRPVAAALSATIARTVGLAAERIATVERDLETVFLVPVDEGRHSLSSRPRELAKLLSAGPPDSPVLRLGISGVVRGLVGLRHGYGEARRALELGAVFEPGGSVHVYPELALDDLFRSSAVAGRRLVEESLGRLLASRATGQRHIETLSAYLRSGMCLKSAAASLGIHPNSLLYRMRQIRSISGIDLGDSDQRLRVEIALRLLATGALCDSHNAPAARP